MDETRDETIHIINKAEVIVGQIALLCLQQLDTTVIGTLLRFLPLPIDCNHSVNFSTLA